MCCFASLIIFIQIRTSNVICFQQVIRAPMSAVVSNGRLSYSREPLPYLHNSNARFGCDHNKFYWTRKSKHFTTDIKLHYSGLQIHSGNVALKYVVCGNTSFSQSYPFLDRMLKYICLISRMSGWVISLDIRKWYDNHTAICTNVCVHIIHKFSALLLDHLDLCCKEF